MVKIAGYSIGIREGTAIIGVILGIYLAIMMATPNPSPPTDDIIKQAQIAAGTASVTTDGQVKVLNTNFQTRSPAGVIEGQGDRLNPGETADYCAEVRFEGDADYTYVGTYLQSGDFDFPEEGETEWSSYYQTGTTHEICNDFTAPSNTGFYDIAMYCDFNSPGCDGQVDSDTMIVEEEQQEEDDQQEEEDNTDQISGNTVLNFITGVSSAIFS